MNQKIFRINLSGRGAFVDEDSQVYDENAELASAEIVMPLLFQGKRNMQVSSWAELNLPDFAPQALSLPDMAIIAERGNMCEQGGMLYYKGISYQDYLDLAESIKQEGLKRAENSGIIFIDEIDKVAVSSNSQGRQDPSKEGVQRDLLPIVEGSIVNTKYGSIKTDHILFIAAGAFSLSKPSDLIAELQGRFPLRVELNSLDEEVLYKILTQTKNSILKQYEALMAVEEVSLKFSDEAIRALAHYSQLANEKTEDIGARRLHTVVEQVIEEISFEAENYKGQEVEITESLVKEKLETLVADSDVARYIL